MLFPSEVLFYVHIKKNHCIFHVRKKVFLFWPWSIIACYIFASSILLFDFKTFFTTELAPTAHICTKKGFIFTLKIPTFFLNIYISIIFLHVWTIELCGQSATLLLWAINIFRRWIRTIKCKFINHTPFAFVAT